MTAPERPSISMMIETGIDLLSATIQLRLKRFEGVVERWQPNSLPPARQDTAALLTRALRSWEKRLPFSVTCLPKALAARAWLVRRGHAATLHYGARGEGEAIEAHVWVTSGDVEVVGCTNASAFREISRFPARD